MTVIETDALSFGAIDYVDTTLRFTTYAPSKSLGLIITFVPFMLTKEGGVIEKE